MNRLQTQAKLTVWALRIGGIIPFLYFGIQLVAAPFYPGYSFLNQDASTLGSAGSSFPVLFNTGAMLVGVATLIAAWGFWQALWALDVHPLVAGLTALALVSSGLGSLNAGIFPLPDPRHSGGPLGLGTFLLPVLLPIAIWPQRAAQPLKAYLAANLLAFVALIPIMSGLIQVLGINAGLELHSYQNWLNEYHGLLQRFTALLVFVPIAVVAHFLLKRRPVPAPKIA